MRVIADLQIHSRHSRATSKDLTVPNLEKYARIKGVSLLGTGDFQHPKWWQELWAALEDRDGSGIYYTKTGYPFLLQTEVSLIYRAGGKGRRVHHLIFAPDKGAAAQVQEWLGTKGRLDYDGRPIFGMSSPELVEGLRTISRDIEVIPAHAWTPWFGIFGSMSGFDSLKQCFEDQTKHIHAIETGISSDPAMNWRLSQLKDISIVSFSDAHSYWPWRLGREATVFDLKALSYKGIIDAIRTRDGLSETIEFYPEEGKYHFDGHRACGIVQSPAQTSKSGTACPKCRQPLTIGVAARIDQLADLPEGHKHASSRPFRSLMPLHELIAMAVGKAVNTQAVWGVYNSIIKQYGSEFNFMLDATDAQIAALETPKLGDFILAMKRGEVQWKPGFDGVYGRPIINGAELSVPGNKDDAPKAEKKPRGRPKRSTGQKGLGEF